MLIDLEDYRRVSAYRWSSNGKYPRINRGYDGKQHNIYLHHFLIGMPVDRKLEVDHINRDREDNRKVNLRFVTKSQNNLNKPSKGYYWDRIRKNWPTQKFGRYRTENEARYAVLTKTRLDSALTRPHSYKSKSENKARRKKK